MKTLTASRWLTVAGACAVLFFLLGAPQITDGDATIATIGLWIQVAVALVGLAALALGSWRLFSRRSTPE